MEHIAQGKRSDTLGLPHSRVSAPCKGKSFNPLCYYSYLIADLAVLKWNIVCIFCSIPAPCLKAFALTGRDCSNTRYPGCRFACPGLGATLGFQPALAKSETWITLYNQQVSLVHVESTSLRHICFLRPRSHSPYAPSPEGSICDPVTPFYVKIILSTCLCIGFIGAQK